MGWQLTFILWMVLGHWGYCAGEVYTAADLASQVPGYVFLIAMTVTSFRPRHWRLPHKIGIYFVWSVVWSTYWYELYYYDDIQGIDGAQHIANRSSFFHSALTKMTRTLRIPTLRGISWEA